MTVVKSITFRALLRFIRLIDDNVVMSKMSMTML